MNASYTLSRSRSLGDADLSTLSAPQDPDDLEAERGPSNYDIRHRFAGDVLYELPFAHWWDNGGLMGGSWTAGRWERS